MPKECCKETFAKIPDDEPIFIIRGKDKLAAHAVTAWLNAATGSGVNTPKIIKANEHLAAILQFQNDHPERCKLPD